MLLGMLNPSIIKETPDKPNIFLDRRLKNSNIDIASTAESVYLPELKELVELGAEYPVTLCYMPLEWCSDAQLVAIELLGEPQLDSTPYAIVFSTQDQSITSHIMRQLKMANPTLRLVFCSTTLGMGFDSPCVSRIIHAKPARTMVEFVQQLGRAGRQGQRSTAITYFNASDIAANVPGMMDDMREYCQTDNCLRLTMLKAFGYSEPAKELPGCQCCVNCRKSCECSECQSMKQDWLTIRVC